MHICTTYTAGYKANRAAKRKEALDYAERNGILKECFICCENCFLEEDMVKCDKGEHEFCKNCVKQHSEAQIGESLFKFLITERKALREGGGK